MKCGALVLWKTNKRGVRRPAYRFSKANQVIGSTGYYGIVPIEIFFPGCDPSAFELCDGDVEASVGVENDWDEGGECNGGHLEVGYFCKKCGNNDFRELTNADEISYFLTQFVDAMPEEERNKLLAERREVQAKHEEEAKAMAQKMKKVRDGRKK